MKKTITLLFLSFVLFACSNDDDDNTKSSSSISLNPPSWILGDWISEDNSAYSGFSFSSNDIFIVTDLGKASFKESAKQEPSLKDAEIYDESTSSTYTIHVKTDAVDIVYYEFSKVSSTAIAWDQNPLFNYIKE